jgi:hypothetical protein
LNFNQARFFLTQTSFEISSKTVGFYVGSNCSGLKIFDTLFNPTLFYAPLHLVDLSKADSTAKVTSDKDVNASTENPKPMQDALIQAGHF